MTDTSNTETDSTDTTVELRNSGQFHNLFINDQMVASYDESKNELAVYDAENKNTEEAKLTMHPETEQHNTDT